MESKFTAVYPRAGRNLFAMAMLAGISTVSFLNNPDFNETSTYIYLFMMVYLLVYVAAIIKRRFFTERSITFGADYVISSSGEKVDSSDIKHIYMGHKRIGLKVKGKRLVPMGLYFCFNDSEEKEGFERLKEWADYNQIEVKDKFFLTLM